MHFMERNADCMDCCRSFIHLHVAASLSASVQSFYLTTEWCSSNISSCFLLRAFVL